MLKIMGGCAVAVCLTVLGCGSSGGSPGVNISGIQAGQTVNLNPDDTFQVNFSASNFTLQPIGNCGGNTTCGQAYLNIDGAACNIPAQSFNAITPTAAAPSTSTLFANFSFCPANGFSGNHQLTVSLHRDDGTEVIGNGNAPAEATVSVIVTGGSVPTDGGNP